MSSTATSRALQVVEKIEEDTGKIRETTAQTNAQLDKFEQQLVTHLEQLKRAWETDHKVVTEQQQLVDSSIVMTKKTLEDNANGLTVVNQTLELLTSTLSLELKKLAGKLEEKEKEKEKEKPAPEPEVSAARNKEKELRKTLDATLAENAKLLAKKKFQLNELSKSLEIIEGILSITTPEQDQGMSKASLVLSFFFCKSNFKVGGL